MHDIEWKKQYEVNNSDIDSEHRIFVHIINKIKTGFENGISAKSLDRLVEELLKYADFHFCSEENIMLEVDYPGFEHHKKEHSDLLMQLRNMVFSYNNSTVMDELLKFLVDWFVKHTIQEDKKLAQFLLNERQCPYL